MTGLYLGGAAATDLRQAQRILDVHVTSSGNGLCLACGLEGPCRAQLLALRTLGRYGRLPARRPGATCPDRIALAPAPGGFSWLTTAERVARSA